MPGNLTSRVPRGWGPLGQKSSTEASLLQHMTVFSFPSHRRKGHSSNREKPWKPLQTSICYTESQCNICYTDNSSRHSGGWGWGMLTIQNCQQPASIQVTTRFCLLVILSLTHSSNSAYFSILSLVELLDVIFITDLGIKKHTANKLSSRIQHIHCISQKFLRRTLAQAARS